MSWSVAVPNLLIGLREGFEASLIITILLGAMRKLAPERSRIGLWIGVAAAAAASLSFGAILTFTRAEMSPKAQEIFAGMLSVAAVVLVTSMIFWMRRAARGVSGELHGKVGQALIAGGSALSVTAFIAVAREGLETALFVWANAQAADATASPLLGVLLGLLIAITLCALLYRRVLAINLAKFFKVTGGVLVVIVAGVLAYGVGDLQNADLIPGRGNRAFDISAHVDSGSWWMQSLRGITNLDTRMTWLQVVGYVGYLLITMSLFLRKMPAAAKSTDPSITPAAGGDVTPPGPPLAPTSNRPRRRLISIFAAIVVIPVAIAAAWVAIDGQSRTTTGATAIMLHEDECAIDWAVPKVGEVTYLVTNGSGHVADVELVQGTGGAIVAEIEVLGPGTSRQLSASLGAGQYTWQCRYDGGKVIASPSHTLTAGASSVVSSTTLVPTTDAMMAPVLVTYRGYVAKQLGLLKTQVAALQQSIAAGDRAAAQRNWVIAHLIYHRMGAAYDAFGDAGSAVGGLAQGLAAGTADPEFAGFHKIELDLWSGRPTAQIVPQGQALVMAVNALEAKLPEFTFDPNDVTIRAHEILEDTSRFTLTGQDDYGSHSGFATAQADLDGDRVLVGMLADLIDQRSPGLIKNVTTDLNTLQRALRSVGLTSVGAAPRAVRHRVNAATGQLLETLSPIPDLLEIRVV